MLRVVVERGADPIPSGISQHRDVLFSGADPELIHEVLLGEELRLSRDHEEVDGREDVVLGPIGLVELPGPSPSLGLAVVVATVVEEPEVGLLGGAAADVVSGADAFLHQKVASHEVDPLSFGSGGSFGLLLADAVVELADRRDLFSFRHCFVLLSVFVVL